MLPQQHVGTKRTRRGLWLGLVALEALLDAEGAAGDVLHLARDVLSQADLVVGEHLQHQPQVQPPLLLGQPVPVQGDTALEGTPREGSPRNRRGVGTHSKSVTFLSSVTGLKATTFFRSPITQAVSPELANTRPGRGTLLTLATSLGAKPGRLEQQPPASPSPRGSPRPRLTLAVDLLQLLRHPQHCLHSQLGPVVPVKGGRGSPLGTKKWGSQACPALRASTTRVTLSPVPAGGGPGR